MVLPSISNEKRRSRSGSIRSSRYSPRLSPVPQPMRSPRLSAAEIVDAVEREQEGITNSLLNRLEKLKREKEQIELNLAAENEQVFNTLAREIVRLRSKLGLTGNRLIEDETYQKDRAAREREQSPLGTECSTKDFPTEEDMHKKLLDSSITGSAPTESIATDSAHEESKISSDMNKDESRFSTELNKDELTLDTPIDMNQKFATMQEEAEHSRPSSRPSESATDALPERVAAHLNVRDRPLGQSPSMALSQTGSRELVWQENEYLRMKIEILEKKLEQKKSENDKLQKTLKSLENQLRRERATTRRASSSELLLNDASRQRS